MQVLSTPSTSICMEHPASKAHRANWDWALGRVSDILSDSQDGTSSSTSTAASGSKVGPASVADVEAVSSAPIVQKAESCRQGSPANAGTYMAREEQKLRCVTQSSTLKHHASLHASLEPLQNVPSQLADLAIQQVEAAAAATTQRSHLVRAERKLEAARAKARKGLLRRLRGPSSAIKLELELVSEHSSRSVPPTRC